MGTQTTQRFEGRLKTGRIVLVFVSLVSLVSLGGVCTVSVRYDCASITDTDLFARCLKEGFDEVLALSGNATAQATVASLPKEG